MISHLEIKCASLKGGIYYADHICKNAYLSCLSFPNASETLLSLFPSMSTYSSVSSTPANASSSTVLILFIPRSNRRGFRAEKPWEGRVSM